MSKTSRQTRTRDKISLACPSLRRLLGKMEIDRVLDLNVGRSSTRSPGHPIGYSAGGLSILHSKSKTDVVQTPLNTELHQIDQSEQRWDKLCVLGKNTASSKTFSIQGEKGVFSEIPREGRMGSLSFRLETRTSRCRTCHRERKSPQS